MMKFSSVTQPITKKKPQIFLALKNPTYDLVISSWVLYRFN